MTGTTDHVLYAAVAFLAIHLLPATPLRAAAIGRIGLNAYRGLFSLLSAAVLGWLILAFAEAPHEELWAQAPWTRWVPLVLMPIGLILFICSVSSRNPSMAGMEHAVDRAAPVAGIITITRHPMLWSFALWGLAHLPANGDRASLYFFGSLVVLALAGMPTIDRRKADEIGPAWGPVLMRSSAIPFLAAIQGRTTVDWRGIGWWRPLAGLFLYALVLGGHRHLFGVSPWP